MIENGGRGRGEEGEEGEDERRKERRKGERRRLEARARLEREICKCVKFPDGEKLSADEKKTFKTECLSCDGSAIFAKCIEFSHGEKLSADEENF